MNPKTQSSTRPQAQKLALGLLIALTAASPPARAEYYKFSGPGGVSLSGSDIMYQETRYPVWPGGTYNARWFPSIGGATSTSTSFYSGVAWNGNWNTGTQSNSYLQSFWGVSNPVTPGDAVTPEWWHPDMHDVPSIGEGASGKVDGQWPFASGTWYPTALRIWQPTNNPENISKVGQWCKDGASGQWKHFSTFRMPFLATHFNSDTAFIEDTAADGPRRVDIRNYYFRKSGTWTPGVTFQPSTRQTFERGNSGVIEGGTAAFFETSNESSYVGNMGPGAQELTHTLTMPATPTFDPAVIGSVTATATSSQLDVKWAMTTTSSPQFSYKIEVFPTTNTTGTPALTVTKIEPDVTEVLIPTTGLPTPTVKLTITDVFDQLSAPVTATASSPTLANASTPSGTVAGLNYKYYESSFSALPDFSTLSPSSLKQQGAVNLPDITVRMKHTSYACQFTGYVNVPADGIWLFSLGSCDGSRLLVDGATVIDSDGAHSGGWEKTGAAALKAGRHPVELQYFKNSNTSLDDDQLRLSWEGPGVAKTLMAESCWSRVPTASEPVVTLTSPAGGATISATDAPLTATVTANGNSLNSVRFFNKNTVWATKTGTTSPFATTALLGAGANHLKARLVYGSGAAYTIDSPPVDITATQQALSPWTFTPVGLHAFQSAASYNAGAWSMVSDGFNIAWQEITGDETIVARVANKPNSSTGSQFDGVNYDWSWSGGVVFRENLVANAGSELGSRFVALYKENGNATRMQSSDDQNAGGPVTGPDLGSGYTWFKLQRAGTLFTAWLSNDGSTWTQVGTRTMATPFAQKMYVGLFTLARPSTNPNPQWWKFDNVSFASAGAGFQITQHPASKSAFPGTTVQMSATVVSSNPLTYQWQHDGTNIPGATSATLTLGPVQAVDAGSYRVFVSDGITAVTSNAASLTLKSFGTGYQRAVEKLGPLAYWRLNETGGPTAVDYVGAHNGTFVGALTAAQAGPRPPAFPAFDTGNAAIKFNGSGSRIEVPALNLNTNTLTMSAWVKRNGNAPSFSGIVFSRAGTSTAGLTFGNNNELRYTWNDDSNTYNWNSGLVPPDGQWTFVSLVVEPTRATIYMNPGTGLVSATNNVSHGAEAFDGTLCIGQDTLGADRAFNGTIDEVSLFNRVVTAAEVATLSSGNTAPVFASDPMQGPYATDGSAYAATLVGTVNDSDPGDTFTYAKVSGPAWLNVATNGALSGTPLVSNVGANSFTVRVTDSKGATATATLNITVSNSAQNDAPAFTADPINFNATEDSAFSGQLPAIDMDTGDTLTFTKVSGPPWLTVSNSGALSGTPANAEVGPNAFTVRVTDGSGAFDQAALNITVSNVNDAPQFTANPITGGAAGEDTAYSGTLVGSATDVDAGDSLTYNKVSGPPWLSVSINGALSGTPGTGDVGSNSFAVRVTDSAGLTADATLNIAVAATASNGTWTNAAGGSWPATGNWSGGTAANGTGKTANFGTLNLTADAAVTLDGARTIGNLTFGDTTPSNNWVLNGGSGGPLTLAVTAGTPTVTVSNQTATINAEIAGSQGLLKTGGGTLALTFANNYSGGTSISGGTLQIGNNSALGSGIVTVNSGGTLDLNGRAVGTVTLAGGILNSSSTVDDASVGNLTLSGGGTLNNTGTKWIALSGSSISGTGDLAIAGKFWVNNSLTLSHTGRLVLNSGQVDTYGRIAFSNGGVAVNGGNLNLNGGSQTIGSLSGTGGTVSLAGDAGTTVTINQTSGGAYSGQINGSRPLVKTGTAALTLSGANNNTGDTTVNGGTLLISGSLANTATTITAAGTLGGSGTIAGTVSNNGTLAPGNNAVGNLTVNNTVTLANSSAINLEFSNWTGAAGTGWDKLTATSLDITATSGSPVALRLSETALTNFTEVNTSFVIAQTTSGITGFSANKFVINTTGLTLPHGTWAVQQSGNNLVLAYTRTNNAPAFTADPMSTPAATEDVAYSSTLAGRATDPDVGETLTYSKVSGPAWLAVSSNGGLTGTPANNDVGANNFTVRVTDSKGATDDAVLTITVTNVNDAPAFTSNPVNKPSATESIAYSGTLTDSVTDVDTGDTRTFSKVSGPAWLSVASNGALSGTPAASDIGANAFGVRVTDAGGLFADATLNITVNANTNSGTWTNVAGGSWPSSGNWQSGIIANGSNASANFNTLNLTADTTVTLDGTRTLGNLTFADTTPSHNWTLNTGSGGTLTFAVSSGSPVISVANQSATINTVLAGNQGVLKSGAGTLTLGAANTYTGGTALSQGTMVHANDQATGSTTTGAITMGDANTGANNLELRFTTGVQNSNNTTTAKPVTVTSNGSGTATVTYNQGGQFANVSLNLGKAVTIRSTASGSQYGMMGAITGNGAGTGNESVVFSAPAGTTFYYTAGKSATGVIPNSFLGNLRLTGGGTVALQNLSYLNGAYINGTVPDTASVTVDAGTTWIQNWGSETIDGLNGGGTLSLMNGATTVTVGASGGSGNFSGVLGGSAGFVKLGAGTQTLGGANTYTGATTVSAGTLRVNGSLGASATTIQSGGTLAGTGSLGGALTVQSGATLAPGAGGIGTLTVNNTAALAGTTAMEISKSGTTLTSDRLSGVSTLTHGGTLTVTNVGPDALVAGNSFTLFSATNRAGSFSSVSLPSLVSGLVWDQSQLTSNGTITVLASDTDADGDGFTNALEVALGTSPSNSGSQPASIYAGLRGWWKLDETSGSVARDTTGRPQDGTLVSSPAWTTGINGGGLALNGSTQSVSIPNLNQNTNTVTLSAWVKRNGNQSQWAGLVFDRGSAVSGLNFGTGNELRYHWNNDYSSYSFNSGLTVPDNTWTFCAVVVEPTKATIYMQPANGTMQSAVNTLNHPAVAFGSNLFLGQDPTGGRFFNGTLDQVLIHNRALSSTEIGQLYAAGNPPAPGTVVNPYAAWASSHGVTGTTGDPDGDGIANLLEFYLDGDPLAADASVLPTATLDENYLTLSFMRRDDAENFVGGALIDWGSDLAGWTEVPLGIASTGGNADGVTIQVDENGGEPDTITVRIPRALAEGGKLFARLKVTE